MKKKKKSRGWGYAVFGSVDMDCEKSAAERDKSMKRHTSEAATRVTWGGREREAERRAV